jgi:hypothetical protein
VDLETLTIALKQVEHLTAEAEETVELCLTSLVELQEMETPELQQMELVEAGVVEALVVQTIKISLEETQVLELQAQLGRYASILHN